MISKDSFKNKEIEELSLNELAYIHLSDSITNFSVKDRLVRSTLSFAIQNVRQALNLKYSKQVMPYITLCAILDQLGICYDTNDNSTKYKNGLKRALVIFGELDENDELITVLYALRNGLLHNVSLTSFDKNKNKYYKFRYNSEIDTIYKKSEVEWNGCYETLDSNPTKYTSNINVELFANLVFSCLKKANALNYENKLKLRLEGGLRQLFFDYLLTVKK